MNMKRRISYDGCRATSSIDKKVYEEMLLKELPGNKKSNQPMHAVLESSLDYYDAQGNVIEEGQRVRNHALIHYFASLANSNDNADKFDFDFVESLINNGADINSTDKTGQTIFHEVARSWNKDVASFLIERGADFNKQDQFGRSALHVAAAVDHVDMVEFLLKTGANINIATFGEGQMPIHYAARNGCCRSLKMLLGYGANIDSRDSKNKTPLQVAAEMCRDNSAKLLVQHGAPAGVKDHMGNSALAVLIEKLPDVAVEALDQFHSVNAINCKEYFFLNYIEGMCLEHPESPAYSALEIAVQNQEFDVILHPVMKRLILTKWNKFGLYGALSDLVYNLVFAVLFSVLAVTTPSHGRSWYTPWSQNVWRLVISILVLLLTVDEIRKQLAGIMKARNRQKKWLTWRVTELQEDLAYCHPRWPQEEMYLKSDIEAIEDTPLISRSDGWIYLDWLSLSLILATIACHVAHVLMMTEATHVAYLRIITVLLLVLWFRILKFVRPFEGAGPFVVIFLHVFRDIATWMILVSVIGIPFICAFSITFGALSTTPVKSYSSTSSLLYNMFSMVVVNDHDFESLRDANPVMARILCGIYIGIMAIINLNLLIALLSETFSRIYSNAIANATMQRAKTILLIERSLGKKKKHAYQEFIKNQGSPEVVDLRRNMSANSRYANEKSSGILKNNIDEIHTLLNERFAKQYGNNKKSDFDVVIEKISDIHRSREQARVSTKTCTKRLLKVREILVELCSAKNIPLGDIDLDSSEEDVPGQDVVNDSRLQSKMVNNMFDGIKDMKRPCTAKRLYLEHSTGHGRKGSRKNTRCNKEEKDNKNNYNNNKLTNNNNNYDNNNNKNNNSRRISPRGKSSDYIDDRQTRQHDTVKEFGKKIYESESRRESSGRLERHEQRPVRDKRRQELSSDDSGELMTDVESSDGTAREERLPARARMRARDERHTSSSGGPNEDPQSSLRELSVEFETVSNSCKRDWEQMQEDTGQEKKRELIKSDVFSEKTGEEMMNRKSSKKQNHLKLQSMGKSEDYGEPYKAEQIPFHQRYQGRLSTGDDQAVVSDNELLQRRRSRSSYDQRDPDNVDSRSVKSVAF